MPERVKKDWCQTLHLYHRDLWDRCMESLGVGIPGNNDNNDDIIGSVARQNQN